MKREIKYQMETNPRMRMASPPGLLRPSVCLPTLQGAPVLTLQSCPCPCLPTFANNGVNFIWT